MEESSKKNVKDSNKDKSKRLNIFDWVEEDEAEFSLADDTYSMSISNYSKERENSVLNDTKKGELLSTTHISEYVPTSSVASSETASKISNVERQAFDSIQNAFVPLKDSLKNIFQKSIKSERFRIMKPKASSGPLTDSIPVFHVTLPPKMNRNTLDLSHYTDASSVMQRIISNHPYTFCEFQSLCDKEKLIIAALDTCHSTCIIKVVLFLRETLKHELFKMMLEKYPEASNEYHYFLKSLGQLDALKTDHSKPTIDQLLYDYLYALSGKLSDATIDSLGSLYKRYHVYPSLHDYTNLIRVHSEILKLQLTQKKTNQMMSNSQSLQLLNLEDEKSLMTVMYRLTLDYLQRNPTIPYDYKKIFYLNDMQFEYIIVEACAELKIFDRLKKFYSNTLSTGLFKTKIPNSATSFENICYILKEKDAPEEVIYDYIRFMPDKNLQLYTAENLNMYETIIQILLEMKDKDRLNELAARVAFNEKLHNKIVLILNNPTIKWK